MCKKMIEYLSSEPKLKKSLIVIIVSTFLISILWFLGNLYIINQVYVERIRTNDSLVQNLVKRYPQSETDIVKIIEGNAKSQDLSYGKKILQKYGYDDTLNLVNDETFNKNIYNAAFFDLIFFILIVSLNIIIFRGYIIKFIDVLKKLSSAMEEIMDGKFSFNLENNEDGIISRINDQFYQMSRIFRLNIENMRNEKEDIKSLITDISHQIKTPLSSIKLFNSLLIEDNEITISERKEFLETIRSEVNKLEWLVGSLIKMSRLEAGMIKIRQENKPIRNTIYKAINNVCSKVIQKNIEINFKPSEDYLVFHDEKWTEESVANILENAVKYTKDNGKIDIEICEMSSFVRIDIKDNGIGIPKKDFNNIFKRFFRGNSKEVQAAEGSGVGLYLAREIIERQGGNITVDSVINKGSKFSIYLQNCKCD